MLNNKPSYDIVETRVGWLSCSGRCVSLTPPERTGLSHYFKANGITDAARREAILLTVVGPATSKQLRCLVSLEKMDDKTYAHLAEVLKNFHSPKPSKIVQRYKLNSRYR